MKGGMEAHIYHLTKQQIIQGNQVTIIFNGGEKISGNDVKFSKIKLFKIKPEFLGVITFGIISIFYLLVKNKKFDIVHVHGDWSSILIGRLMVYLGIAKKDAFTFHGGIQNNFSHNKLLPFFLKNVFVAFVTGFESFQYIKKHNSNAYFQPSGVNPIFFEKESKNAVIGKIHDVISVANFFPVKNHKFIIEIAQILKEYSFVLVGNGPTLVEIENEIKKRKLSNVNCVGFKDINDIKKLLEESKLFLLTSLEEGTPTSMMEAITMGLPVVISDVGGISNFIEKSNGSIVKEFNAQSYSEIIKDLIENNAIYKSISENNYAFSKRFDWSSIGNMITSKYV
ncbi:hypothetical protein AR687_00635 [Flavobacteriaceae bacterium CRH]|nr:hypothetical protein AR687_00635 [Flavobacteriaceae bacterium CRH]